MQVQCSDPVGHPVRVRARAARTVAGKQFRRLVSCQCIADRTRTQLFRYCRWMARLNRSHGSGRLWVTRSRRLGQPWCIGPLTLVRLGARASLQRPVRQLCTRLLTLTNSGLFRVSACSESLVSALCTLRSWPPYATQSLHPEYPPPLPFLLFWMAEWPATIVTKIEIGRRAIVPATQQTSTTVTVLWLAARIAHYERVGRADVSLWNSSLMERLVLRRYDVIDNHTR